MNQTNYHVIIGNELEHLTFERKGELDKWLTENCVLPVDKEEKFGKLKDGRHCLVMRGYPMSLGVKVSVQ